LIDYIIHSIQPASQRMELSNYAYTSTIFDGHTLTIHDVREVLPNNKFNATIEGLRYNGTILFNSLARSEMTWETIDHTHSYIGNVLTSDGIMWVMSMYVEIDPNIISESSNFDANIMTPGCFFDGPAQERSYVFERVPELVKGVHDG